MKKKKKKKNRKEEEKTTTKLSEYGQTKSSKSGDWFACNTFLSRQLLQSFAMAAHRREWKAHNYNYVICIRLRQAL